MVPEADRQRIAGSLAFYLLYYGVSAVMVILSLPMVLMGPRPLRALVRAWSRWHRFCARHLLGIRVRIEGKLIEGPVLYAIKHESFFEALDLPMLLEEPVAFAKKELFEIPGWGLSARAYGLVPVARDQGARALRQMVAEARRLIAQGRPLVIFPEGTRVPHGTAPRLQPGFAGLYKLLGLPVVPVAVNSGPLYHRRWKRPGVITYRVGEPIAPGLTRAEIEERVHRQINALNSAVPDAPCPQGGCARS